MFLSEESLLCEGHSGERSYQYRVKQLVSGMRLLLCTVYSVLVTRQHAENFLALDDQLLYSRALHPSTIPSLKSAKDKKVIRLSIDETRRASRASLVRDDFCRS